MPGQSQLRPGPIRQPKLPGPDAVPSVSGAVDSLMLSVHPALMIGADAVTVRMLSLKPIGAKTLVEAFPNR
jgi:hypothetical protein